MVLEQNLMELNGLRNSQMPKYFYICSNQEHKKEYSEHRDSDQLQHFTHCECGSEYTEVTE